LYAIVLKIDLFTTCKSADMKSVEASLGAIGARVRASMSLPALLTQNDDDDHDDDDDEKKQRVVDVLEWQKFNQLRSKMRYILLLSILKTKKKKKEMINNILLLYY
jgi:hypothetical protein